MPPIICFDASEIRERDWANIVSCHVGQNCAYTWRLEDKVLGKKVLGKDISNSAITAVSLSACGNFAILGRENGSLEKYNVQSGLFRGSFPPQTEVSKENQELFPGTFDSIMNDIRRQRKDKKIYQRKNFNDSKGDSGEQNQGTDHNSLEHVSTAHSRVVHGVVCDSLNQVVISGSQDGFVHFWHFTRHTLLHTIEIGSAITLMEIQRDSGLLAVACDDLVIRVIDVSTQKIVRVFRGHSQPITDIAFTTDSRWLATASEDTTIRVWDLPTGRCIDWLQFNKAVTGLSFSPSGEFLATSHAKRLGIYLWSNRTFFENVFTDHVPQMPFLMDLPSAKASDEPIQLLKQDEDHKIVHYNTNTSSNEEILDTNVEFHDPTSAVPPIADGLITFSRIPKAQWANLPALDLIKARNKPIEPPKVCFT